MILDVTCEVELTSHVPEVADALATGMKEHLEAAAPYLAAAASRWLYEHTRGYLGDVREAIVVWRDAAGVHIGIDSRRLLDIALYGQGSRPIARPAEVQRLIRVVGRDAITNTHTLTLRDQAAALRLQIYRQYYNTPVQYWPGMWLKEHIDAFHEENIIALEASLAEEPF